MKLGDFFLTFPSVMEGAAAVGREVLTARLVVVGVDSVDSGPCVMLSCDNRSYLLNCPEGTQRLCEEYKIRLPKLAHVFFTRLHARSVGGFPGMMLTMCDIGGEELGVSGPPGTRSFLASLRYFVKRPDLMLRVGGAKQVYSDENLSVQAIEICSARDVQKDYQEPVWDPVESRGTGGWVYEPDDEGWTHMGLGKRRARGNPPAKQAKKVAAPLDKDFREEDARPLGRLGPPGEARERAHVLSIRLADVRGKFDVARARALGLPPGRAYAELARGNSVETADGRTVMPHQCLEPNVPGPRLVVLECPDESYAEALLSDEAVKSALQSADVVLHVGCARVMASEAYGQWIKAHCQTSCQQYTLGAQCNQQPLFRSAASVAAALGPLAPVLNPPPAAPPRPSVSCPSWVGRPLAPGDAVVLAPRKLAGLVLWEAPAKNLISGRFLEGATPVAPWRSEVPYEVAFLGTGASRPSKYRNVTGQLVRMGEASVLLDCGEGTIGQLARLRGQEGTEQTLTVVCISHLHADHHLGLAGLLYSRGGNSLTIVAPPPLRFWAEELREWHPAPPGGWTEQWIDCGHLVGVENSRPLMGLARLQSVPVIHSVMAYGFVLDATPISSGAEGVDGEKGWRVTYSGDTRPCAALEEAGRDCNLLIHEATFADGLQEDALNKRHCTVSEAVDSGHRMHAEHVVLTHFSQRYPKSVSTTDERAMPFAMAWDLMQFQPHHLPDLPRISALAASVFPDVDDE